MPGPVYADYDSERTYELMQAGQALTAEEVSGLEQELLARPDAVDLRIMLLANNCRLSYDLARGVATRAARAPHILWLIGNCPGHPVLAEPEAQMIFFDENFAAAKTAWMTVLAATPEDIRIILNAAVFVLLADGEMAEELARRGEALAPLASAWSHLLSLIYEFRAKNDIVNGALWEEQSRLRKERYVALRRERGQRVEGGCDHEHEARLPFS